MALVAGSYVALTLLGKPPSPQPATGVQPPPTDLPQRGRSPMSMSPPPNMAGDLAGYRQPGVNMVFNVYLMNINHVQAVLCCF